MTLKPIRHAVIAAVASAAVAMAAAQPASAQIVFDPSNYAQNVMTAARELQQVNNQITSLQNQAQMLLNQGRNLASLPFSALSQLQGDVARTQQLLSQAQHIAFNVGQIDQAFQTQYGSASLTATDQQLVARAQARWQTSVGAFQDALRVQAGVVGNLDGTRTQMSALVTSSQGATGALQAAQAGNQLMALQAKQLADLTALVAAQGRAQALDAADQASAKADAQVRFRQFMDGGAAYSPGSVTMFH
jgi:P-type conjugative transfer protein TrbJ